MPTAEEFFALDLRVGTVLDAAPFPEARKPSIRLRIDFGPEMGTRDSIAVTNIGTRRIAGFTSEVLVLGAMPTATEVVLLRTDQPVANGTRIG
jgi:tRNA-binding protein